MPVLMPGKLVLKGKVKRPSKQFVIALAEEKTAVEVEKKFRPMADKLLVSGDLYGAADIFELCRKAELMRDRARIKLISGIKL